MIQKILTPLLQRSGAVMATRRSKWRRDRLAILCYHSFAGSDEHVWDPSLYMHPGVLRERFELMREEGYRVLSLSEGLARLYAGTLPEQSVVLTFDDGTRDFATMVVPLLKEYGYPATVYLSTWYCGQPRPVFQVFVKYIFWKGRGNYDGGPLWKVDGPLDLETNPGRNRAADLFRRKIREEGITLEQRDELLGSIAARLGVDYAKALAETNLQLMTPVQVGEVSRSGLVQVELHTHRHQTPLDRALFQREIRENRERIESMTGQPARHFCYPSGVFDDNFLPWLREMQVESATTGESGLASQESNPLLLPRIVDTTHLGSARLSVWLSGAGQFVRRRGRAGARALAPGSNQA